MFVDKGGMQSNFPILGQHGPISMNWHGSIPTTDVDTQFEPNFRQFDFYFENADSPNVNLTERLRKTEEGESSLQMNSLFNTNMRCTPVLVTSFFGAAFVNFIYTRLLARSGTAIRWSFWSCYAVMLGWNNFTKFIARERYFQRDFQRNQLYASDELRTQRDRQRVREALYEKNFVTNPIAEYRVKAWQAADRFA